MLCLTMFFYAGLSSYTRIQEDKPEQSDYLKVQAKNPPSGKWAADFLKETPPGAQDWLPSNTHTPEQPFTYDECPDLGVLPPTLYSTYTGSGKNVEISINNYQPGTTYKSFADYKRLLANCWDVSEAVEGLTPTTVLKFEAGSSFYYGDVVFFVKTFDPELRDEVTSWALSKAARTLPDAGCMSLAIDPKDENRNLYIDREKYTGWIKSEKIVTKVDLAGFPTQKFPEVVSQTSSEIPEGPLPVGFPVEPEEPFARPEVPDQNFSTDESFTQEISFEVPDPIGPGCGWTWAGMKPPKVDEKQLDATKRNEFIYAQTFVDDKAQGYVTTQLNKIKENMLTAKAIERWNKYAIDLKTVHDRWNWLKDERNKIEPSWRGYIDAYETWMNFDNRKANAQKQYDAEVNQCTSENLLVREWEKKWGELYREQQEALEMPPPTTTTTPSTTLPPDDTTESTTSTSTSTTTTTTIPAVDIPPRPLECTVLPALPAILQEAKPAQPNPPAIPDGVTIPDSWPKPAAEPTVSLN